MHMNDPNWLSLALVGGGLLLMRCGVAASRLRKAPQPRRPAPASLPALDPQDSAFIIRQASRSALQAVREGSAQANPHPRHTRAHILWETQFHSVVMEIEHDDALQALQVTPADEPPRQNPPAGKPVVPPSTSNEFSWPQTLPL